MKKQHVGKNIRKDFHVMVVDRDQTIREALGNRLEEEGYTVERAISAEEALKGFEKKGIISHIIFSDVRMGGMDGVEFLSRVNKLHEDVKFIIMTSYTTVESAVEAVRLGAYDYISKDEFDNIDAVVAVCNRAADTIRIKYQNLSLMEKTKVQNTMMEKKARELERKSEQLARLNKSVMRSQLEAEQRLQLANILSSLLDPAAVLQSACDLLAGFHENTSYLIMALDKDGRALVGCASSPKDVEMLKAIRIEFSDDFDQKKLKFFLQSIDSYPELQNIIKENFGSENFICRTLMFKQEAPAGIFIIIGEKDYNLARVHGINEIILQITTAYENAVLHARVNEMAIKDGLTNLYNHKHFMEELEKEVKKGFRYRYPVSLLFFDIDHFKHFNDRNGHQVGDTVLRKVAQILQANSRDHDYIAIAATGSGDETGTGFFVSRYGGEEFAVILPHTDIKGAHIMGERLRVAIEKADFPFQEKQPGGTLTISMGVAEISEKINIASLLVLAADAALYKSKHDGRNRLTLADESLIDSLLSKGKLEF